MSDVSKCDDKFLIRKVSSEYDTETPTLIYMIKRYLEKIDVLENQIQKFYYYFQDMLYWICEIYDMISILLPDYVEYV